MKGFSGFSILLIDWISSDLKSFSPVANRYVSVGFLKVSVVPSDMDTWQYRSTKASCMFILPTDGRNGRKFLTSTDRLPRGTRVSRTLFAS